tara:strand:- start:477 stop:608 length:132 start_codon:yes stop_codon:yes gene_type:complete
MLQKKVTFQSVTLSMNFFKTLTVNNHTMKKNGFRNGQNGLEIE